MNYSQSFPSSHNISTGRSGMMSHCLSIATATRARLSEIHPSETSELIATVFGCPWLSLGCRLGSAVSGHSSHVTHPRALVRHDKGNSPWFHWNRGETAMTYVLLMVSRLPVSGLPCTVSRKRVFNPPKGFPRPESDCRSGLYLEHTHKSSSAERLGFVDARVVAILAKATFQS